MKSLIIIGARGYAREVFSIAQNSIGYNSEFTIKGFLDDKANALDDFESYAPILTSVENYEVQNNDVFICALGSVKWKKFYIEKILKKGGQFINLIHNTAIVSKTAKIGVGNVIGELCNVSNDVEIGNFVIIQYSSLFGHDAKIGNYCHIGAFCFCGGFTVLHNEVTMFVRATVLDRLTINQGATVGASSLVIKNVQSNKTVFGIPAKVLEF